eukprot:CAMPEP_0119356950 /NCGR_PEP_ID=MMETSP1334-20130426/5442_1 /TAXON_ID=127549 /ORGANISM="Calcidiscus leptoporus, Strain RCC1130" /LENGTH=59 /DNA_ID=CAMNT_0007371083 /DNA_START=183 /DNA_END=362 /DNA_ORIENTATION=-
MWGNDDDNKQPSKRPRKMAKSTAQVKCLIDYASGALADCTLMCGSRFTRTSPGEEGAGL